MARRSSIDGLPEDVRRVYDLVVRRFVGAFFPDAEFDQTVLVVTVGKESGAKVELPSVDASMAPSGLRLVE